MDSCGRHLGIHAWHLRSRFMHMTDAQPCIDNYNLRTRRCNFKSWSYLSKIFDNIHLSVCDYEVIGNYTNECEDA